jgi:hypothetical protein
VKFVFVTDIDDADGHAPEAFRHEPGTGAASGEPTHEVAAPPSRGNPRALWNQPLWRQLLALPALAALLTWRIWGTSTWWWILLAVAGPLAVVYAWGVRRIPRDQTGSRRQSEP